MAEDLTVEYAEMNAENSIAERRLKRKYLAWKVPYSPYHKVKYEDLSIALNYMLLVLVPYFIVLTVFYIMHYAVDRLGPYMAMIDVRDVYNTDHYVPQRYYHRDRDYY